MKTLRKEPVFLSLVEFIPEQLQPGVIYYSELYHGAAHLCLCGCGMEVYTPIKPGEWSLVEGKKGVTMTPSLAHRVGCKSHYIITNGVANFV